MPVARRVRMIRPDYFRVEDAINPHMCAADGHLNTPNLPLADYQWTTLKATYERLGLSVDVLPATPWLPDMVFAANQALPALLPDGCKVAVLSHMANPVRHREVDAVARGLAEQGYDLITLPDWLSHSKFEGMGDALWVPGERLLLGGWGYRTSPEVYAYLSEVLDTPVVTFELKNPRFYHLDTCLSLLDANTVMAHMPAFTPEGQATLRALFPRIIEVPLVEADSPGFACNAHCPDQRHVILQAGSTVTNALLEQAGFVPVPVDTSEFILSGGSVFCLKLMLF